MIDDASTSQPRLCLGYNSWAGTDLPRGGPNWSMTELLDRLAAEGFTWFEIDKSDDRGPLADMLKDRGFRFGLAWHAQQAADIEPAIEAVRQLGADYITVQISGSLVSEDASVALLETMYELTLNAQVPLMIETHRACITQDLLRTIELIDRLPMLRLTGDISHYLVAGSMRNDWSADVKQAMMRISERCDGWHARFSSGEQVQIDIGDGSHPAVGNTRDVWHHGIKHWLATAQPDDVLPFIVELGPPPFYSISDLDGNELSDRWEQGLIIKGLIEQTFATALADYSSANAARTS